MRLILLPILFSAVAAAAPTRAAESYDSCTGFVDSVPAVITTQGTWCLRADISTAITEGNAITVAVNNVTIDCNHFKLGGLAAGPGSNALGIQSTRTNTTVRNCRVRGFRSGIQIDSNGGNLVESNRLDGNYYLGIRVSGDGSIIRDNQIFDTGGSTLFDSAAYGIQGVGNLSIIGNTVQGVSPTDGLGTAYGIIVGGGTTAKIRQNQIDGLSVQSGEFTFGIHANNSGSIFVRDNDIHGPGLPNSFGVLCGNNAATASGNFIARVSTAVVGCTNVGNTINPS